MRRHGWLLLFVVVLIAAAIPTIHRANVDGSIEFSGAVTMSDTVALSSTGTQTCSGDWLIEKGLTIGNITSNPADETILFATSLTAEIAAPTIYGMYVLTENTATFGTSPALVLAHDAEGSTVGVFESGAVWATAYYGDGSNLTGISSGGDSNPNVGDASTTVGNATDIAYATSGTLTEVAVSSQGTSKALVTVGLTAAAETAILGAAAVAGSNNGIQYNADGSFGAEDALQWDNDTNQLLIGDQVSTAGTRWVVEIDDAGTSYGLYIDGSMYLQDGISCQEEVYSSTYLHAASYVRGSLYFRGNNNEGINVRAMGTSDWIASFQDSGGDAYSTLTLVGGAEFASVIYANSSIDIDSTIGATGTATLAGGATISGGTLDVSVTAFMDDLELDGDIDTTGAAVFGSTMYVTGAATFNSTADFSGAARFDSTVGSTGTITAAGGAAVSGGTLDVSVVAYMDDLELDGDIDTTGAATIGGSLTVSGTEVELVGTTVTGTFNVAGAINQSGGSDATFSGNVVASAGSIKANVDVASSSSLYISDATGPVFEADSDGNVRYDGHSYSPWTEITYASSLVIDATNGANQATTLTGNVSIGPFCNFGSAGVVTLVLFQDGTGGRTMEFADKTTVYMQNSTSPTLGVGANDINTLTFKMLTETDGTTAVLCSPGEDWGAPS